MIAQWAKVALVVSTLGLAVQAEAQSGVIVRSGQTVGWSSRPATNPFTVPLGPVLMTVTSNATMTDWYLCNIPNGSNSACWEGGFKENGAILIDFNSSTYTFSFSKPVTRFATQAWYDRPGIAVPIRITSYLGSDVTGTFDFTTGGGTANEASATVIGAIDEKNGFDKLVISGEGSFAVNQITFKTSTVPEPTSVALIAIGLAGLGVAARRRRPKP